MYRRDDKCNEQHANECDGCVDALGLHLFHEGNSKCGSGFNGKELRIGDFVVHVFNGFHDDAMLLLDGGAFLGGLHFDLRA